MKILVIDDELLVARAIQRMLRDHDVVIEADSTNGVSRVVTDAARGEPFDLVLCDLRMGGMTGIDVMQRLRMYDDRPMLVLMSGHCDVEQLAVQADAVLTKPFSAPEIRDTIARLKLQRVGALGAAGLPPVADDARHAEQRARRSRSSTSS